MPTCLSDVMRMASPPLLAKASWLPLTLPEVSIDRSLFDSSEKSRSIGLFVCPSILKRATSALPVEVLTTSSFASGLLVPMPTFPFDLITILAAGALVVVVVNSSRVGTVLELTEPSTLQRTSAPLFCRSVPSAPAKRIVPKLSFS